MLTPTEYADIFVAAVEGGINYWAKVDNYQWHYTEIRYFVNERTISDEDDDYAYATIIEDETGTETFVDSRSEVWHNAVAKAAEHFGKSLRGFHDNHDADYADVAMQFAVLGEIVYG